MSDSRGPLAVVSAIVVVSLWLIWISSTRGDYSEAHLVGAAAASSPVMRMPLPAPGQPTVAMRPQPDEQVHAHDNQVFVCGYGWLSREAAGAANGGAATGKAEVERAHQRLIARLAADPSALARALAILLDKSTQTPSTETVGNESEDAAFAGRSRRMSEATQQLAQLASSSTDARLYGFALRACRSGPNQAAPGHCAALNTLQWVRLDPQDAAPWLHVLDEASAHNDRAAVDDAIFHIGSSARWRDSLFLSAGEIARLAGQADSDVAAAWEAVIDSVGIAAAQSYPLPTLAKACRAPGLADANRMQLCDRAAETMTQRSDSLLVAMVGSAIGRNVGWSQDRVDAVRGLMGAATESSPRQEVYDCTEVKRSLRRFARQAEVGEVGYVRDWIAAAGLTVDTFARKERDRRLQREITERAASAAQTTGMEIGSSRAGAPVSIPYSAAPPPAR